MLLFGEMAVLADWKVEASPQRLGAGEARMIATAAREDRSETDMG